MCSRKPLGNALVLFTIRFPYLEKHIKKPRGISHGEKRFPQGLDYLRNKYPE
jgi:hypothetical protein